MLQGTDLGSAHPRQNQTRTLIIHKGRKLTLDQHLNPMSFCPDTALHPEFSAVHPSIHPFIPPHPSQPAMGLMSEDMNCCVCFQPYSRRENIPRVLHCEHTFCGPCLEAISRLHSGLLTVCCPLCRWITCCRASLPIAGSLFVNTEIWDQIAGRQQEEEEKEAWIGDNRQTQTSTQYKCSSLDHSGVRIKLQSFWRRMRHNEEG
eukprot:XP_014023799.1 PREDICTED: RING finger protein 208-like [Salmo salar]